jgi:PAS domain S-box-containing protein
MERETDMQAARARDYAAALDAARDGMVRLDRGGRILGMNKGAEHLFGYDQKEAAGETFLGLLAPVSHAAATAALDRLTNAESGPVESFEALVRDQTGRLTPARIDLGRFANQPEPDYFLLISQRAAVEAEATAEQVAVGDAEHESRAKTELLSRVSHEMRTPLHAIMGFAEVILEQRFGPIGNDRYRDYIKDIHASARHVLSLAGDLLDMSKIELGKMDLEFTPIDLNRVIRECVTLMQPQAARERIIMRLSLYDRLPNVMADERSMKQVMINLMSNAVKYNEPGGQVIVSTALDDAGAAIVRVRDTGVGMSDSDLEIALEPFRRVPGAKAVEGSGLGLPLTKALVEANHADFTIKSRKDQGTLVEIAFPAAKAAQ